MTAVLLKHVCSIWRTTNLGQMMLSAAKQGSSITWQSNPCSEHFQGRSKAFANIKMIKSLTPSHNHRSAAKSATLGFVREVWKFALISWMPRMPLARCWWKALRICIFRQCEESFSLARAKHWMLASTILCSSHPSHEINLEAALCLIPTYLDLGCSISSLYFNILTSDDLCNHVSLNH